jgi:hypothetical protein
MSDRSHPKIAREHTPGCSRMNTIGSLVLMTSCPVVWLCIRDRAARTAQEQVEDFLLDFRKNHLKPAVTQAC